MFFILLKLSFIIKVKYEAAKSKRVIDITKYKIQLKKRNVKQIIIRTHYYYLPILSDTLIKCSQNIINQSKIY